MEDKKIISNLNIVYYGMMVLALLALCIMYYLTDRGILLPLDRLSPTGMILQYFVIGDALITIPGGLYGFKWLCDRLRGMENGDEQLRKYQDYALMRIVLVSNSMVFGIVAYYLLGYYQSMMWVAAIGAIGWYFTKPTTAKMQAELMPKDPNQETY